jgi:hypothetical protein
MPVIHKDRFYMQCKRIPAFADEIAHAQDCPFALAKRRLFQGIKGMDGPNVALKFLECREKARYAPKTTVNHEGAMPVTYYQMEETTKAKTVENRKNSLSWSNI